MNAPDDRCEFVLTPEEVYPIRPERKEVHVEETAEGWDLDLHGKRDGTEPVDKDIWNREYGAFSCCRDVWKDGRCIWHAETDDKPVADFVNERTDHWERLDGAVLSGAALQDAISFRDCSLSYSDCSDTDFAEVEFTDADLLGTDLSSADLSGADLTNADLSRADLTNALLWEVDFVNADLFSSKCLNADMAGANLSDADLWRADFTDTGLDEADLINANLRETDFPNADFRGADLTSANLQATDFTSAYLAEADLSDAYLWKTDLTDANLREATLSGVFLREAIFNDAIIDESTRLVGSSGWEITADKRAEEAFYFARDLSTRLRAFGRSRTTPSDCSPFDTTNDDSSFLLKQAEIQYRTLQRLHRENDLKQDSELAVREKHARRKRALAEKRFLDWFKLAVYRWPLGYGEKLKHVVSTSLFTIFLFAFLYPFYGFVISKNTAPDGVDIKSNFVSYSQLPGVDSVLSSLASSGTVPDTLVYGLGKSLYFSVITFTTLGYGDIQPIGFGETLAIVESFLGALLMAFLVFVLGRRTTW